MSSPTSAALQDMANRLRLHSIESTSKAGSGHPTSCCSMAELMAVLFFDVMKYHLKDPRNGANDRFVLSKGHAAPILYAAWAEAGLFPIADLLKLREFSSDLEGHPTPRLPFVDVATGSLGQGLSAACGMAYAGKYLDRIPYRVYCLMGDGESQEGSVWEAASFASHYQLDNLVAIVDVNRLGQSEPTMVQHHMEIYQARFSAFGFNAIVIDGHDVDAVRKAFAEAAATRDRPTAILAKTFKGHGIPGIDDQEDWHGKPLGDKTDAALSYLHSQLTGAAEGLGPVAPAGNSPLPAKKAISIPAPAYAKGEKVATRVAYGNVIAKLGAVDPRVVALDGDTKNSTYSIKMREKFPDRFIECFIAEQNLVGVGVGLGARGKIPYVSTFACFLSRAFDQIRMAAISQANVKFVGSHVGVSIGEDGPSQMALEDLAMFRAIPNLTLYYPSDAVSAERACELAANQHGMAFIRTSRPATPVVYDNDETFEIGRAKVVRKAPNDRITLIGAGVTLHECLKAADLLAKAGIPVRVIDPFTIKPLDRDTILSNCWDTGGLVLTVEDHYPEGGIGDAVAGELGDVAGLTFYKLAVRDIPRSGKPDELLDKFGISAAAIATKVKTILGGKA
ncbi:MAG TPA: transketolase [Planctomycetia bacterium]|nr:transketolase [Planctomycetia bacterium]